MEGKYAQDSARSRLRVGAARDGAIRRGRRQLRRESLRRSGGSGAGHPGRGCGDVQARADGAALLFKVNVANIDNPVAAHIHCGAVGVNGPVGVTLFVAPPAGGAVTGTLAEGTITAPDAGNACGWTDLAAVLAAMQTGDTYVNV